MKFKPTIAAAASGKLGGIVFSHNRGGMYTRVLSIPTNPATPQQEANRLALFNLMQRFNNVLTDVQREAWQTYANNVSWQDKIGESINLSANSMYVRSNVPRVQAGMAVVDDAPTVFDLGEFTAPVPTITAGTPGSLSLAFNDSDAWASEDGAALLVRASRTQNPTINFFKGPYRFADSVDGVDPGPAVTPAVIALPFTAVVGNKTFLVCSVTRADGRLSLPYRFLDVAS